MPSANQNSSANPPNSTRKSYLHRSTSDLHIWEKEKAWKGSMIGFRKPLQGTTVSWSCLSQTSFWLWDNLEAYPFLGALALYSYMISSNILPVLITCIDQTSSSIQQKVLPSTRPVNSCQNLLEVRYIHTYIAEIFVATYHRLALGKIDCAWFIILLLTWIHTIESEITYDRDVTLCSSFHLSNKIK
jgi:hypothetical protein